MCRKTHLLWLIVILILISACTSTTRKTPDIDIYQGTEGLALEFIKNAPPPKVFEDSNFPIAVRISNKGAYSIDGNNPAIFTLIREKDYVKLSAYDKDERIVSQDNQNNQFKFRLDGKSQIRQKGDEMIVTFNAATGKLEPQSESKQSIVTANACYPYKTLLTASVCIDPDITKVSTAKKVCEVKDLSFSGQGAPVAVTKVEQNNVVKEGKIFPQYIIYVEDRSTGNPINANSLGKACGGDSLTPEDTRALWNIAAVNAKIPSLSSSGQLACTPSIDDVTFSSLDKTQKNKAGLLRFRDKKSFVKCELREGMEALADAFTTQLRVEIEYGYVQNAGAVFTIQKPQR